MVEASDTYPYMYYRLVIALLLILPSLTLAHTKWFAESELTPFSTHEPTSLYLLTWGTIIILILLGSIWLEKRRYAELPLFTPTKPHVFARAASTFVMVTGTFFIIAGTHEYIFSPNLTIASGVPAIIVYAQIFVGLALLLGIASRTAGIILALLWVSLLPYVGWVEMIEDIWVLSTALFIIFMGNEYFSIVSFSMLRTVVAPFKKYALSVLRIGTGSTLMILGLTEKILAPEFGINFLEQHHWNFMALAGFNFSDYLFTLSAGSVEFLLGLILTLGIVTRLTTLVLAVIFLIPIFILGPIELAGHLPHFASLILLFLFGNGGHFAPFSPRQHR
jgi:uncharacterized membrane protein YphA (DoxX/SURF4 family)